MDWEQARAGFEDELLKISEVNLRGLSPETVLGSSTPLPPENPGFQKAQGILNMATKTAAARASQMAGHPQLDKLTTPNDKSTPEQAKSVAGYGLAGLGSGAAVHKLHQTLPSNFHKANHPDIPSAKRFEAGLKSSRLGTGLMVGGAAAGLGYGAYRALKRRKAEKEKTSAIESPGIALRSSQQVAKFRQGTASPSIKTQIAGTLIGHKGA